MSQTQQTIGKEILSGSLEGLKERFENVSAKPATREVVLLYSSCCGCGCSDIEVKRTVAYDSPLKSGDRIMEMHDEDEVI